MVRRSPRMFAAVLLALAVTLSGATSAAARPDGRLTARNLRANGKGCSTLARTARRWPCSPPTSSTPTPGSPGRRA
ncbi:hypothetical protein ACFQY4_15255 [Catellatospora bangladeshensis]|uniref:hypothetical protein n=1 Tax=Catellatospora bangladeshensis TaxID=310355 RepID=UPI0036162380